MKKTLCLLLCLAMLAAGAPAARAKGDSFTLMVYLCGTDLESDIGAASDDLKEMIKANIRADGDLTVYVQTGGTKKWHVQGISNGKSERWTLSSDGLKLEQRLGRLNMAAQDTFSDFIEFGLERFPADRYGLLIWDHGCGANNGFCVDEYTQETLYYPGMYAALTSASKHRNYRKFDFVGFDACLMASYETAIHLEPFANYMIASEELEPGSGWDYDVWLKELAKNPAIDMEKLGIIMVDSFVDSVLRHDRQSYATLSLVDLRKLDKLKSASESMGKALANEIDDNFATISRLRNNMRSFGEISSDNASDMIDMTVFAEAFSRFDPESAKLMKQGVKEAVVYERHTNNLDNVSGISILVPISDSTRFSEYIRDYNNANLMPQYGGFVKGMLDTLGMPETTETIGNLFGTLHVSEQSIQAAQIDWFSQYAEDQSAYENSASSLWGDLYGSDYGESNSDDFSLDSFLSALFGSDDVGYDYSYDDSAASLWGDLSDDVSPSFSSNNSYGSGGYSPIWSGLGEATATPEPDETPAPDATQIPDLWSGLGATGAEGGAPVHVELSEGQTITLNNPFVDTDSSSALTVTLTPEQMKYLASVEANLMMDISEPGFDCYVELGYNQNVIVNWDEGKIYGVFTNLWPTLDGQLVCAYDQIANARYVRSLIPVTVNGDAYYLLVVRDEENIDGVVKGYTEGYTDEGYPSRICMELKPGDVVVPQYELIYWYENGEQQSEPFEGDPITVGEDGTIPYGFGLVQGDAVYKYGFCLKDIYGEYTYTDFITVNVD